MKKLSKRETLAECIDRIKGEGTAKRWKEHIKQEQDGTGYERPFDENQEGTDFC